MYFSNVLLSRMAEARYRPLPLALYVEMETSYTDIDQVSITDLPVTLLFDIQAGEVELCNKRILKPVRDDIARCFVDHPYYAYIPNASKAHVIRELVSLTGHGFMSESSRENVFFCRRQRLEEQQHTICNNQWNTSACTPSTSKRTDRKRDIRATFGWTTYLILQMSP